MTDSQQKHIEEIQRKFNELVAFKYKKGSDEHGGLLWEKTGLIDMAIEEAVDLFTYLHTLKSQNILSRNGRQNIMVDMDGTLCEGESWTEEQVLNAEPRKEVIDRVNKLYEVHFICIYTARRNPLIAPTIEWLDKHGVKYHAISNKKVGADCYLDDKAKRPEEI